MPERTHDRTSKIHTRTVEYVRLAPMRRFALSGLVVLVISLGGCGDDDDGNASSSTPTKTDAAALARVADKYMKALVSNDGRAACQTRTPEDRRELARLGGSCAKTFQAIFLTDDGRAAAVAFDGARARASGVEIRGDRARVPIFHPGQDRRVLVLLAQREDGRRWLLVDVPEGEDEAFMRGE